MTKPAVSVVVATWNRAHLLPRLVEALERQEGAPSFEALVVDDASTDDTIQTLDRLAAGTSLRLRVLRQAHNTGPAGARNVGWRSAVAPLIVFTDDDCVPKQGWLAAMVGALRRADVVQGPTEVDPLGPTDWGPFARILEIDRFSWKFETCNVGYRRQLLERLGGLDERYRRPFGEDVDLGWRAVESGATVAWEPGAVVMHAVDTTGARLRDWLRAVGDARRQSWAPLMIKGHTGARRVLHRGVFYRPHHPRTILALVGMVAVAASPRGGRGWLIAATLSVPWLRYRTAVEPARARRRNAPVVLPLRFVVDAAEVAAVIVGSARFRSFVL